MCPYAIKEASPQPVPDPWPCGKTRKGKGEIQADLSGTRLGTDKRSPHEESGGQFAYLPSTFSKTRVQQISAGAGSCLQETAYTESRA